MRYHNCIQENHINTRTTQQLNIVDRLRHYTGCVKNYWNNSIYFDKIGILKLYLTKQTCYNI